MSMLWCCIASLANWALASYLYVTNAMPRLYRMFPGVSAAHVGVQALFHRREISSSVHPLSSVMSPSARLSPLLSLPSPRRSCAASSLPLALASHLQPSAPTLTSLNLAPLAKVPQQRLLALLLIGALVDLAHIQRTVGPVEGPDTAHVVAVLGMLLAPEAVARVLDDLVGQREAMQVTALGAVGTASARKVEAAEAVAGRVGAGVACVARDDAAGLGERLAVVSSWD